MTRRVVKPQPSETGVSAFNDGEHPQMKCPYGQVGDILWVRETFFGYSEENENKYVYFADTRNARPFGLSDNYCINEWGGMNKDLWPKWKPSLFMPKAACRIFLKITNLKVEKLQDVSRGDCMSEGCPFPNIAKETNPVGWFKNLWQSLNGEQSWNDNPWVWVIEFERIEKPENFI
jgi:hypothetical protein